MHWENPGHGLLGDRDTWTFLALLKYGTIQSIRSGGQCSIVVGRGASVTRGPRGQLELWRSHSKPHFKNYYLYIIILSFPMNITLNIQKVQSEKSPSHPQSLVLWSPTGSSFPQFPVTFSYKFIVSPNVIRLL